MAKPSRGFRTIAWAAGILAACVIGLGAVGLYLVDRSFRPVEYMASSLGADSRRLIELAFQLTLPSDARITNIAISGLNDQNLLVRVVAPAVSAERALASCRSAVVFHDKPRAASVLEKVAWSNVPPELATRSGEYVDARDQPTWVYLARDGAATDTSILLLVMSTRSVSFPPELRTALETAGRR